MKEKTNAWGVASLVIGIIGIVLNAIVLVFVLIALSIFGRIG